MDKTKRVREGKLFQVYLPVKLLRAIRKRKAETHLDNKIVAEKLLAWWASGGDLSALSRPNPTAAEQDAAARAPEPDASGAEKGE